jgi:hypothetical protein
MRRTAGLLLIVFGLCLSAAFADPPGDPPEPPVRLKRKAKPPADPAAEKKADPAPAKKDEPPAKAEEAPKGEGATGKKAPAPGPDKKAEPGKDAEPDRGPDPARLEEEARETVARVGKNMQASEDRLGRRDPGDATQQIQRDIVKDLDSLIELNKQRQQQQQQQQQQSSASSSQQQRQQARMKRNQRNQQANQRQRQEEQQQDQQGNDPQRGGGRGGKGEKDTLADLYKDVWGHLPETMRLEMDQYARERFMPRYSELLKQYYTTIAEKGRRKE